MINPFDQLDAQDPMDRLAQVTTGELADERSPLDADTLPPYYCPICQDYKHNSIKHKRDGLCCCNCGSKLMLVNSCFEPPRHDDTHAMEQLITNATFYALGITND